MKSSVKLYVAVGQAIMVNFANTSNKQQQHVLQPQQQQHVRQQLHHVIHANITCAKTVIYSLIFTVILILNNQQELI